MDEINQTWPVTVLLIGIIAYFFDVHLYIAEKTRAQCLANDKLAMELEVQRKQMEAN